MKNEDLLDDGSVVVAAAPDADVRQSTGAAPSGGQALTGKADAAELEQAASPDNTDKKPAHDAGAPAKKLHSVDVSELRLDTGTSSQLDQALRDYRAVLFQIIRDEPPPDKSDKWWLFHALRPRIPKLWSVKLPELGYNELVAGYVSLWSVLEKPETRNYVVQALIGIRCLQSGRFKTSAAIFREIEFQTSTPAALTYVMLGVKSFVRSLTFGTILILYGILIMLEVINESSPATSKNIDIPSISGSPWFNIVIAAVCGMAGSVISILLRLGEFETTRGKSRIFLQLTGTTLPLVGGAFGAFIAALLTSKIVNVIDVSGGGTGAGYLYGVIGFLSGFSERFSRGFIKIAEDRLSPNTRPGGAPNPRAGGGAGREPG